MRPNHWATSASTSVLLVCLAKISLGTPAANDMTPVGFPRKVLGYFTFFLLLLIIYSSRAAFAV